MSKGRENDELLSLGTEVFSVRNIAIVSDSVGMVGNNLNEAFLTQQTKACHTFKLGLKYVFDFVCSLIGLIILIPALLMVALAVYIDSPGPVIFVQQRVGYNGKLFPCFKFRTMKINSQELLAQYFQINPEAKREWESDFKLKKDPRLTRIGELMRRTSLDELPQLINVIRGEMSLVGPRPIVPEEIAKYQHVINDYYRVRPGITGLWQVNGRNDVDYASRVKMDSCYISNWSLRLDLVLLIKTINVVLSKKGAY